jgi:rubrerythrin
MIAQREVSTMPKKPRTPTESLIETLERGIKREEESNRFYLDAAARSAVPRQRKILLQLADEELGHKENLIRLIQAARHQAEIDRAICDDLD